MICFDSEFLALERRWLLDRDDPLIAYSILYHFDRSGQAIGERSRGQWRARLTDRKRRRRLEALEVFVRWPWLVLDFIPEITDRAQRDRSMAARRAAHEVLRRLGRLAQAQGPALEQSLMALRRPLTISDLTLLGTCLLLSSERPRLLDWAEQESGLAAKLAGCVEYFRGFGRGRLILDLLCVRALAAKTELGAICDRILRVMDLKDQHLRLLESRHDRHLRSTTRRAGASVCRRPQQ